MKTMTRVMLSGMIATATVGLASSHAATISSSADTYIETDDSGPNGTGTTFWVRQDNGTSNDERVGIVRFDISTITNTVTDAEFGLEVAWGGTKTDYSIFGADDTSLEELFDESTYTFSDAESHGIVDDTDSNVIIESAVTDLGTLSLPDGSTTSISFSSTDLVDFINADTNNLITLLVVGDGVHSNGNTVGFRSREATGGSVPSLTFSQIPEPASLALLLLGGAAFAVRRPSC